MIRRAEAKGAELSQKKLFDLRAKCADMVKRDFVESDANDIVTAHYNAVQNQCFGERRVRDSTGTIMPDFLWYAYEQSMEQVGCSSTTQCFIGTRTGLTRAEVNAYIHETVGAE